jgi:hypothetical protein
MSPHIKVAIIIAPLLLIGGYIVADYYQTSKEEKYLTSEAQRIPAYRLEMASSCAIPEQACKFKKDNLILTLTVDNNNYRIESSHKLDGVTLGLAQVDRETRTIQMLQLSGPTSWAVPVRRLTNLKMDAPLVMRIALASNGKRYFAEFEIDKSGPWGVE